MSSRLPQMSSYVSSGWAELSTVLVGSSGTVSYQSILSDSSIYVLIGPGYLWT